MREMPRTACAFGANAVWMLHPLSWTHREGNGETPNNLSSAPKRFIHISRNCSYWERQTFHTKAMSLCLIHYPCRHRSIPRSLPSPGKMNFAVRWSFAAWSKDRDRDEFPGLCPHPFPMSAASWDAGRARGGRWSSCPAQPQTLPSRGSAAASGRASQMSTPAPVGNEWRGCENSQFPPPSDLLPSNARS